MTTSDGSLYFKPILETMLPENTLKNKLAYITGGGPGLGKQMAITLAQRGADVINFISPTERLSVNAFKTIIDIVLLGTFNVTSIIAKRLIKEKKEAVFLSILASYIYYGSGYVVPSACAKSGVATLTRFI